MLKSNVLVSITLLHYVIMKYFTRLSVITDQKPTDSIEMYISNRLNSNSNSNNYRIVKYMY